MLKDILRLVVITVASIAILTTYHAFIQTYSVVEQDDAARILGELIPGAVEFKPIIGEDGEPLYFEAFDAYGGLVGYGFLTDFRGMWSDIRVAGGVDLDYRLMGIKVLEQGETPGLGSMIETPLFQQEFVGLAAEEVKITRYGGEVDAISGATVTSKIVANAVKAELEKIMLDKRGTG